MSNGIKVFFVFILGTVIVISGGIGAYFYARNEINTYLHDALAGEQGPKGEPGNDGFNGLSAYQLAVLNGFDGSELDWLGSLVGEQGQSAYNLAVALGFDGSPSEWIISLTGPQGEQGIQGIAGATGASGQSAYELAVDNGFTGTVTDFLNSLAGATGAKGETGATGPAGVSPNIGANDNWWIGGYDTGVTAAGADGLDGTNGLTPYIGTNGNWWIGGVDQGIPVTAEGIEGQIGKSAYELALDNGFVGTLTEWLASLQGTNGTNGANGLTPYIGNNGNWWLGSADTGVSAAGTQGQKGDTGADGLTPFIGANGNWWIGTEDSGVAATGTVKQLYMHTIELFINDHWGTPINNPVFIDIITTVPNLTTITELGKLLEDNNYIDDSGEFYLHPVRGSCLIKGYIFNIEGVFFDPYSGAIFGLASGVNTPNESGVDFTVSRIGTVTTNPFPLIA